MDLAADGREIAKWSAYSATTMATADPPDVFIALGAEPYPVDPITSSWVAAQTTDPDSGLFRRDFFIIVQGPDADGSAEELELGSYRTKVVFDTGTEVIVRGTDSIDVAEVA